MTPQALLTSGVVLADSLVGTSSWLGRTGAFIPSQLLSTWLLSGSGLTMAEGTALGEP